ncbi:MAG: hypothetical protein QF570_16400 [Myxococcota bacterium]|jgi:hypothetical protein|nr:hypothetical protein [Myxococcota bacterium]
MNDDSFDNQNRGPRDAADTPDMIEDGSLFEQLEHEVDVDAGSAGFPRLVEAYRRDGQIDRAEEIAAAGLAEAPERLGGKVALALVMLDKGEISEAREALTGILENVPEVPLEPEAAAEAVTADAEDSGAAPEAPAPALGDTQPIDEPDEDPVDSEPAEHRLYATPLASPSPVLPHFDGSAAEADPPDQELREDEIENAFAEAEARPEEMVSPDELVDAAVRGVEATSADASEGDEYRPSERRVFATRTMANLLEGQGDLIAADEVRATIGEPEPEAAEAEEERVAEPEPVVEAEPAEEPAPLDAASVIDDIAQDITASDADPRAGHRARRQRIIARLEGWLENLRRDPA